MSNKNEQKIGDIQTPYAQKVASVGRFTSTTCTKSNLSWKIFTGGLRWENKINRKFCVLLTIISSGCKCTF